MRSRVPTLAFLRSASACRKPNLADLWLATPRLPGLLKQGIFYFSVDVRSDKIVGRALHRTGINSNIVLLKHGND